MTGKNKNGLFRNAAVFTDIHFGLKNNSRIHLDDCSRFLDWFIAEAHARDCETCLFLGDWHHHRASVNVATMNATIRAFKKLNDAFSTVYFITGNHDLYYRDKREFNSVEFGRDLENFVMIDEIFHQNDVAIVPWLVGNEWKQVSKLKCKYMFGHFELPKFKMNAMVEMPDHGVGLKTEHLNEAADYVFSGHFHKRQFRGNVHYIGNAFPHNYADVGDVDRGAMFLEWGGEPVYVNWPDCPKYRVVTLSELLEDHATLLDCHTHVRVKLDINISYEEANFIRENFSTQYQVREIQLLPVKEQQEQQAGIDVDFESVDQIVISQLETIESDVISNRKLIEIYNNLEV